MPHGHHLIAGCRVPAMARSAPAPLERACAAAEAAAAPFAALSGPARALFLDGIAAAIGRRAAAITEIGMRETGLPAARLAGGCDQAAARLRRFAGHIRGVGLPGDGMEPGHWPQSNTGMKPAWRPVGPVALLDAGSPSQAFSIVGGDLASAFAAGCPVVVKAHPDHPRMAGALAEAVAEAARAAGMPEGVFSLIQDGGGIAGAALVTHPLIRAVGFAGPPADGRAPADLCATARTEPIPFFNRPGAVNPMFLMPAALGTRAGALAGNWAAALIRRAGQGRGRPGLAVLIDGPDADCFVAATRAALALAGPQTMDSGGIAAACRRDCDRMARGRGVHALLAPAGGGRRVMPCLLEVAAADWLDDPGLAGEVFGPFGLIVRARHAAEMLAIARNLPGQRICILHLDPADTALAQSLLPVLERRADRVLANGFPDGIAATGPPADLLAIRRWLRPVFYRNMPADLLPPDLWPQDAGA